MLSTITAALITYHPNLLQPCVLIAREQDKVIVLECKPPPPPPPPRRKRRKARV